MRYTELVVWQKAMQLAEQVFRVTSGFPVEQRYVLASQLQRSAVSVPSNIAEGHGRKATGAYVNHLSIAAGSLLELETQVRLAARLGLLSADSEQAILALSDEVGRMLTGLKSSLERP
jgi:four helix bundle protein